MNRFSDIVPPSKRKDSEGMDMPSRPRTPLRVTPRRPGFPYLTLLIVLLVIAASIGALFYFSTAKVEVTPNTVSAAIQSSFTATQSTGTLPFEIITAQKIATQSVQSSGTKTVTGSASGTVTIYNTQAKPQTLVANTRFATTAGLIFRIHSSVTVPAGSTAKPGSISAKLYADKPGDTYNVGPTSFTVPGLAGTPQASQVYARSTAAMTGGASGTVPVVDAATETQARHALANALAPDLVSSLNAQIPAGYVLLPGAATTTFEELAPAPSSTTGMVDVKEQGTITAIVFPNAALAHALASSVEGLGYQNEPVTLASTSGLSFNPQGGFPTSDTKTFSFTTNGSANFIYTVDPQRIAAAVAGKSRSLAEVALTNYPEVKRAVLILRPFWRTSFPEDPASISVTVSQ